MDETNQATTEAENQHDDGTQSENQGSSTDGKYESQKKRAEKAEAEAKALKAKLKEIESAVTPAPAAPAAAPQNPSALSREETILYAKGFADEEIEYAKKIASIEGVSPLAAAESDLFKTWKKIQDDRRKADDAQLGASTGSSTRKGEKSFRESMTPAEHRALYDKRMGR